MLDPLWQASQADLGGMWCVGSCGWVYGQHLGRHRWCVGGFAREHKAHAILVCVYVCACVCEGYVDVADLLPDPVAGFMGSTWGDIDGAWMQV